MVMLVTIDDVMDRGRIDDGYPRIPDLVRMIEEASQIVLDYIKAENNERVPENKWMTESGQPDDVPFIIQTAVKIVVRNIELGDPPLSQGVMDILERYRDPAMA